MGAVHCYEAAEGLGLERGKALRLCAGASGTTPARCYRLVEETGDLSELQGARLCARAVSLQPARCAQRLAETTDLSDTRIVAYCVARRYASIPPPGAGAAACIEAALERIELNQAGAARLCRGSKSVAPVACFEAGKERLLSIGEDDLISLCAPAIPGGPVARPVPPYGS